MRDEGGGVDMHNFFSWGQAFVESVKDLCGHNRKLLLTYDAYRSHLSLAVLNLFHANSIIVYALPAHTSGKLQPLDVVLFSPFKKALNEAITLACKDGIQNQFDVFDFCGMLRYAYRSAFTTSNILAAFRRSGMWPIDGKRLLSVTRPRSLENPNDMMTVEQLSSLLEIRREDARKSVLGSDAVILDNGYIDTTKGAVYTSDKAMDLINQKAEKDKAIALEKQVAASRKAVSDAQKEKKRVAQVRKEHESQARRRARLCGMHLHEFNMQTRSLDERRAVARLRTTRKKLSTHNALSQNQQPSSS